MVKGDINQPKQNARVYEGNRVMAKTGRHEFVISKNETPIVGLRSRSKDVQEDQETLRRFGNYSRKFRHSDGPWPSKVERHK